MGTPWNCEKTHGQVDVPADHNHRLAHGEQGIDGRVGQDELDVLVVYETRLDCRRDRYEDK
jgi:hypothetical protein